MEWRLGLIHRGYSHLVMKGLHRAKNSDLRIADGLMIPWHGRIGRICPSTKGLQVVGKRTKC